MTAISPEYKIVFEHGAYGIEGFEHAHGEHIKISAVSADEKAAKELAAVLNSNKVSIYHAADVLRDKLLEKAENLSCEVFSAAK